MGRSQVLFNRRKGRNHRGGGGAGREVRGGRASPGAGQLTGSSGRGEEGLDGAGRDGRDGIASRRSQSSASEHPQQRPEPSSHNFEVDRSMSYSDEPNESTTDRNSNSLLDMFPSATATSAGTFDLSFMGAALPAVLKEEIEDDTDDNDFGNGNGFFVHDDTSRASEVSHSSLRLSLLNSTLKRLSLQERFRIPQHLIDTLYVDRIPAEVTPVSATATAAATPIATSHRPRPSNHRALHPSRLASMSSGGTTTAYDGDDDSDAILRSRRSSDDEGSTLPSVGDTTVSTRVGERGTAAAARTTQSVATAGAGAVVVPAEDDLRAMYPEVPNFGPTGKPPNSPARTGTTAVTQSPQSSDAVAAIIQSISEELYLVDPSSTTGSLGVGGSSSAVASRGSIRPSDTMQAVAGTSASLPSSNPQRHLVPSDTMQAVVGSSSSLAYSGVGSGVIRPSDTMQAVVGGTPSASTDRTSRAQPPPKVIPSPTAHLSTPSSAPSPLHLAPSAHPPLPRYMSPTASSTGGQAIKLQVSPGRIPSYPIDLSDVDESVVASTAVASSQAPLHSFSVPEDRRKAIYVEAASKQMRQQPPIAGTPHTSAPASHRAVPLPPYSSGTSVDVVEQARCVERTGSGKALYVDATQHAAGASVTASSIEPDSDAAVMAPPSWSESGQASGGTPPKALLKLAPPTPQHQRKLALHGLSVSGSSAGGTHGRTAVTSLSSATGRVAAYENQHLPRGPSRDIPSGVTDHHTAPTPKASASRPAPQVFFPADDKGEEEFDQWLDSALATKTFDKATSSDEEKEALDDWLDSVIS